MHILIVDDEDIARQGLHRIIKRIMPTASISEASNGIQALEIAHKKPTDIALLDIRMPGMDGIETARQLSQLRAQPAVIFTTAYDSHALQAFSANAIAYLLKPVQQQQLEDAIKQAQNPTQLQLHALRDQQAQQYLAGTQGRELTLVPIDDIYYILAENRYLTAVSKQHRMIVDNTLNNIQQQHTDKLLRVHRNALINIKHIKSLHKTTQGQWQIHFNDIDDSITASRRMLPELRALLKA